MNLHDLEGEHCMGLLADTPTWAEEAPMDLRLFAVLEAVHRLTAGVACAWADEASVRLGARALRPMNPCQSGWACSRLLREQLIEHGHVPDRSARRGHLGRRCVRMTAEGSVEHFSWRAALLPRLRDLAA